MYEHLKVERLLLKAKEIFISKLIGVRENIMFKISLFWTEKSYQNFRGVKSKISIE